MGTIKNMFLLGVGLAAGYYGGKSLDTYQTSKQNLQYLHRTVEDGFPTHPLGFRDSLRINDAGKVELYFGSDSTDVWRKVHADGTVGSFGEKVDEWWQAQRESLQNYFN